MKVRSGIYYSIFFFKYNCEAVINFTSAADKAAADVTTFVAVISCSVIIYHADTIFLGVLQELIITWSVAVASYSLRVWFVLSCFVVVVVCYCFLLFSFFRVYILIYTIFFLLTMSPISPAMSFLLFSCYHISPFLVTSYPIFRYPFKIVFLQCLVTRFSFCHHLITRSLPFSSPGTKRHTKRS